MSPSLEWWRGFRVTPEVTSRTQLTGRFVLDVLDMLRWCRSHSTPLFFRSPIFWMCSLRPMILRH